MKKLLAILVLGLLTLSASSYADDIKRLKIEGMQVGDSLLDHFSKSDIETYTVNHPSYEKIYKDEFIAVYFHSHPKLLDYDGVQITVKKNDKNFTIHGIEGIIVFENAIDECYKEMKEIDSEFSKNLSKLKLERLDKGIAKHIADPEGTSTSKMISYLASIGTIYGIECSDFSGSMPEAYFNNLKFVARSQVLDKFLLSAY